MFHVLTDLDGWKVEEDSGPLHRQTFVRQSEAIDHARGLAARCEAARLIVHGRTGRVVKEWDIPEEDAP